MNQVHRGVRYPTNLLIVIMDILTKPGQELIQSTGRRFPFAQIRILSIVLDPNVIRESLVVLVDFKEEIWRKIRRIHAIERSDGLVAPFLVDTIERCEIQSNLELNEILGMTREIGKLLFRLPCLNLIKPLNKKPKHRCCQSLPKIPRL